jgi:uncharacterized protein
MWHRVSSFILRYRVLLLIFIVLLTVFMGFQSRRMKLSYRDLPLLPKQDSAYIDYQNFREIFGEEANIIAIGTINPNFFTLEDFNRWGKLCSDLEQIEGVEGLLTVNNSFNLVKNSEQRRFDITRIFPEKVKSQEELDSLVSIFKSMPLYHHYLYNDSTNAFLVVLTMNDEIIRTPAREAMVLKIRDVCIEFETETNLHIHYSGLPYINVMNALLVKKEIFIFTGLTMAICLIILFLFFRSFKATLFPALVVLVGVISAMGVTALFGFEINILSGMIPPLIIIIGIPNCIYMLNKYHNEYRIHHNKIKALKRVISKIGTSIFLANLTTACGFATFIITKSTVLREFGILASVNILALFFYSIILIPIIFSFLSPPSERHMKHLKSKVIDKITSSLVTLTHHRRKLIYLIGTIIFIVSLYGISLMKTTGYMVDDIPEKDPIYKDLHFLEENFDGILPLEIIIDTKKPKGILQNSTMRGLDELDKRLDKYNELSSSLSFVNVIKLAKQAFYNGNKEYYSLPSNSEKNFILSYALTGDGEINLANSFIDSTLQIARVSIRMKDVGTNRMNELYELFMKDLDEIFPKEKYDVKVTGSSVVFYRGNQYLVGNLFTSIALAITLISLFMAFLFNSGRMVFVSLIPNILPLIMTAAIMGFTGIPIKASTLLVFSITFGISVDNTIHFLAKYRQELALTNWNIRLSVARALRETGVSMIYNLTILFFGFGVFTLSNFGGTQALGFLVAITLLEAAIANLILLPALLIGLERIITTKSFHEPMLMIYNEEEDIDLDELEISYNNKEAKSPDE